MKRIYLLLIVSASFAFLLTQAATGLAQPESWVTSSKVASGSQQRDYYWTWYDNLNSQNWVLISNPVGSSTDFNFNLSIAGQQRDLSPYALQSASCPGGQCEAGQVPTGMTLTPSFAGLMDGPVKASSLTGDKAILSQRSLKGNSFEEVLGVDAEKLSDHFYWTWYDQESSGYANWIMIANPNPVSADPADITGSIYYEITVAGEDPDPDGDSDRGVIAPGKSAMPAFPGVKGGPVEVKAYTDSGKTTPAKVMASQRVLSGYGTAFNEMPGIPAEDLTDHYIWTWYDAVGSSGKNWVMMANPNPANADPADTEGSIYFEITIAGQDPDPTGDSDRGTINAGDFVYPTFAGKSGGPLEVRAWTDESKTTPASLIASQRVIWGPSFGETPGYPSRDLASDYHWTWYDQQTPGSLNWVLVANPNPANADPADTTGSIYYEITIGGTDPNPSTSKGILLPGQNVIPTFAGQMGGPVEVRAWTDAGKTAPALVMASQRVLWNGHFNEVLGTVLDPPIPPVIPENTEVLDDTSRANLTAVAPDGTSLTFNDASQNNSQVRSLSAGDIVVVDPTDEAPDGLLKKVEGVTDANGQLTLDTAPATLEDAIEDGSINLDSDSTTSTLNPAVLRNGVTMTSNKGLGTFNIPMNSVLYDADGNNSTTYDQVKATGNISISPSFDFNVDIRHFSIQRIKFTDKTTETASLAVTAGGSVSFSKRVEIWSQPLAPISFAIGPVPVWITPIVKVYIGADGEVHASVTTSVTQQATMTAGLQYDRGNWSTITSFTNSFSFQPPTVSAGGSLKAYAGPELNLMLYGVAGPHANIDGYLKMDVDLLSSPWWKLYGGLDAGVGIKFQVLGYKQDYSRSFNIMERLIAQADTSGPPPDATAPTVSNVQPSGTINTTSTSINVSYSDAGSGVNTSSVTLSLDGNQLSGCNVTATGTQCPVSGLSSGGHTISGSVADNAGNASPFGGGFIVDTTYVSGSGTILVTLTWDTPTDIDLYVTDPTGDTSWYGHKITADGGELDYDDTDGYGPEHWMLQNTDTLRYGQPYIVRVHNYSNHSYTGPTHYTVSIKLGEGTPQEQVFWYTGTLTTAGGSSSPGTTGSSWANIANITLQQSGMITSNSVTRLLPDSILNLPQLGEEAIIIPEEKEWPRVP